MIPLVTEEVATITLISPYINSHSQNKLIGLKKKRNSIRFRAQLRPKQDSIVIKYKVKKSQNYESSLVNAERVKSLCWEVLYGFRDPDFSLSLYKYGDKGY